MYNPILLIAYFYNEVILLPFKYVPKQPLESHRLHIANNHLSNKRISRFTLSRYGVNTTDLYLPTTVLPLSTTTPGYNISRDSVNSPTSPDHVAGPGTGSNGSVFYHQCWAAFSWIRRLLHDITIVYTVNNKRNFSLFKNDL